MHIFTFDSFAEWCRYTDVPLDRIKQNLIREDKIPFIPEFVVDCPTTRMSHFGEIGSFDVDQIAFQNEVHISADRSTAYFVNQEDALQFFLKTE
jgi:hypothetical protein